MKHIFKAFIVSLLTVYLLAYLRISADWETSGGKTCYRDEKGDCIIGWQTIDEKKYYFRESGEMVTSSCIIDGIRYKFTSDGICEGEYTGLTESSKGRKYWRKGKLYQNKWIHSKSGKRKYYSGEEGYLLTGKAEINGEKFEFDEKGKFISGERKAPLIAFYIHDSCDSEDFEQYFYTLDADGYYYRFHTFDIDERVDLKSNSWYDRMLKFMPVPENDKWDIVVGDESLELLTGFLEKLEEYSILPMYTDFFWGSDDLGDYAAYGIYQDKNGVHRNVRICSDGDYPDCIDSDVVMEFVNMMSRRDDISRIFWFEEDFIREP